MYQLTAKVTDPTTGEQSVKRIKTASPMSMQAKAIAVSEEFIVDHWAMTKFMPKRDQWGGRIDWTAGNGGMNAGAYLHEISESLMES